MISDLLKVINRDNKISATYLKLNRNFWKVEK